MLIKCRRVILGVHEKHTPENTTLLVKVNISPKNREKCKKVVLHRYTMHTSFGRFFLQQRPRVSRYKLEVGISGLKSQALSPP